MSVRADALPIPPERWDLPARGPVGMACLIVAEAAMFTIFVVAYLFYLGKSATGPQPRDVLDFPVLISLCLFASSATITFAVNALRRGALGPFRAWWAATIVLAVTFLAGTGLEWRRLIVEKGLTIRTNLFGTTFYSLVGLHAFHVVAGTSFLIVVLALALAGKVAREHAERTHVLALYWHFVDAVWVVVLTVVYVVGR
ncbi:MAG TPA: cytochrome c oxidase subunit 3 [Thermoanaerobaculia bacterium]|nr:cytochrome c oxidase subunit 3 [Thermoanaerobaculia bacterium]